MVVYVQIVPLRAEYCSEKKPFHTKRLRNADVVIACVTAKEFPATSTAPKKRNNDERRIQTNPNRTKTKTACNTQKQQEANIRKRETKVRDGADQ